MKTYRALVALLLATGMLFMNVRPALADNPPIFPYGFYGTVKINDANVPDGTVISARINGVQYATAMTTTDLGDSVYSVSVPADDPATTGTIEGGVEGNTVVFFIGGTQATQTGTWHGGGGSTNLDLSATVNVAPVITESDPQAVTMSEDGSPTPFSLTLHATDVNAGDTLTWSISTQSTHGTASASGTGTSKAIGYTPTANYNGIDSFVVQVSDGHGGTDTITVNVTIQAVNDAPVANAQSVTTSEDTAKAIMLTGSDVENSPLTFIVVTQPSHGSLTGTAPNLTYTPNASYVGSDSFTFKVNDGGLDSSPATISITVTAVNHPPVITESDPQAVTMSEDGSPTPFSLTLHATDMDAGNTLTWSIYSQSTHGTASASGTGTSKLIGYTPTANYNGSDSFVVQVSDGNGGIDTITVNVTIQAVNDAPVITEGSSVSVAMSVNGTPTPFDLTLHATDVENDTITWSILTQASHGTASASGTGTSKAINYTPNTDYQGTDSFVVSVSDGNGGTDSITVNVTISHIAIYTLTVNKSGTGTGTVTSDPAGINCGSDCDENYEDGTSVTLTATPTAGSTFDGWSGACTGTGVCTLTMSANKSVTAHFTQGAQSTFVDVPTTYWAWDWIERLYRAGVTSGCSTNPLMYCPDEAVTRAQMAKFLELGKRGGGYTPPAGTGIVFADVPLSYWAVNWIEKLYADGITNGCMTSPLRYCPDEAVTRSQMAKFLLLAKHGAGYTPPAAVGIFTDVPTTYWAANWIEQLYAEGITSGCSTSPLLYCPDQAVTRAQMAKFLVITFNLP